MTTLLEGLKIGCIIGVSVFLALAAIRYRPSIQWVEVDVAKLIQRQALYLGQQDLPKKTTQQRVMNFIPQIQSVANQLSQQHKVLVVMKGTTLSSIPDWTDKIAHQLENTQ